MGHGRRSRKGQPRAPKLRRVSPISLLPNSCMDNVYPDVSCSDPGLYNDDAVFSNPDPATYDYELRNPDQPARSQVGAFTTPPQPRGPVLVCGEQNLDSMLGPTNSDPAEVWVGKFFPKNLSQPVDQSQFEDNYLCDIIPLMEDPFMLEGLTPLQKKCRKNLVYKAYCLRDLKQYLASVLAIANIACSPDSPLTGEELSPEDLVNACSTLNALTLSLDIPIVFPEPSVMVALAHETLHVLSRALDDCLLKQDRLLAAHAVVWRYPSDTSPVAKPGDVSLSPGDDQTELLPISPNVATATVPSSDCMPGFPDTNDMSTLTPADQSCEVPLENTHVSLTNTKVLVSENKSLSSPISSFESLSLGLEGFPALNSARQSCISQY
ncbi:uncharacterized protein LOC142488233 [Ascaphus truei]|uniref:uncharacterized protein LOC142488233 n=1 Tax=Ascaphus truei TaxID=8439 RepID=UPI003F5AB107